MKVAICTTSANSVHGVAIRKATGGRGNHSLVLFEHDDGGLEYFESHWKKDKTTGHTGVRRCEWEDLRDWLAANPNRQCFTTWLPFDEMRVQTCYRFAVNSVGKIRYAHLQLWHNLIKWYPQGGSRNANTCSEFASRCVFAADARLAIRYILKQGYRTHDMIAPSGRDGLYEAAESIRRHLLLAQE